MNADARHSPASAAASTAGHGSAPAGVVPAGAEREQRAPGVRGGCQPRLAMAWLNVADGRITAAAFAGSGW